MRNWEEGKLTFDDRDFIADKLGYRNVTQDEKTGLGNAHTGLMKMMGLSMQQDGESKLLPYGKKTKIERSSVTELDIQHVMINAEKIKISDLFWNGSSEELSVEKNGTETSLKVNNSGPIGGAVIIYNEILMDV